MANRAKRTPTREERFLSVLRMNCNVTEAAQAAGVGRRTVYEWREADSVFRAAWDEAEQEAADRLEREAWRRAVDGVDKPVTFQGAITATYKEYSDRLIEVLLKAHRPDKYKDRVAAEHSGPGGGPIQTESRSSRDLAKAVASMLAKGLSDGEKEVDGECG